MTVTIQVVMEAVAMEAVAIKFKNLIDAEKNRYKNIISTLDKFKYFSMTQRSHIILPSGAGYNTFLASCRDQTVQPNNSGNRVRRSSRFKSFDGQSWTTNTGTDPITIPSVVLTTSPAQFARLLLAAYRNRHLPRRPITTLNRGPRVYLNLCCRNQIVVEQRTARPDGKQPTYQGDTQCITRTIFENCVCTPTQIEQALRDICRVESAIESGQTTFAGIQSGCPGCPIIPLPETSNCLPCGTDSCTRCSLCPKTLPYIPATLYTSLTEQDIQYIINWWQTGKSFEPPLN